MALLVIVVIAFGVDISAARYFRGDTLVRDGFPPRALTPAPYFDPAPWSVWLPSDDFVRESVRSGHLPLWDRLQGGGYSPVLTVQNGVFHPLRWLMALVPRASVPSVLIVLVAGCTFCGTWLLLRDDGATPAAAATGTVLFTFSGAMLTFVHFSGAAIPLAHLPWLVLAQRRRRLLPLVIVMALLLISGHPLLIAEVLFVAAGIAAVEAWEEGSLRPVAQLAAAGVVAMLADAFAILPPLAARADLWTYKTGSRAGSVYALFYPIDRWFRAVGAIVADSQRPLLDDSHVALYIGPFALVLALVGAFSGLTGRRGAGLFLLMVAMAVVAIPGPWMVDLADLPPIAYMNRWYLTPGLAFVFALLAARGFDVLARRRKEARTLAVGLAAAMAVLCALRTVRVLVPARSGDLVRGEAVRFLRADRSQHRVVGFLGATHLPNASRLTRIEDVRVSAPILTRRTHLWWLAVDPNNRRFTFPTFRMTDRLDSALVGDFNIKYILQSRMPHNGIWNLDGPRDTELSPNLSRFPLLMKTSAVEVRAMPDPRPRAHFAETIAFVPNAETAARMLAADRRLAAHTALVESSPLAIRGRGDGSVAVRYPAESRVVLDVDSREGGLVVLHDSFDRGWRARVDGAPAAILPVNILSRGVVVAGGRHRIEMGYRPPGFAAGMVISLVTLALLASAAWISHNRAG